MLAPLPRVRLAAPLRAPLVSVRVPLSVRLLLKATPLALAIVKLFKAVAPLGTAMPVALPPKDRLEAEVVCKLASVPAMAGPLSTRVLAPTVNVPLVRVSVPLIVRLLFKVTPLALLIVRLFRAVTLLGMFTPVELPPKERLDDEVVCKLAGVPAIAGPFSANVLAPTLSAPLVRVSVPPTVTLPPRAMPLARLTVRLFRVMAGRVVLAPVPPKVMFAEAPPVRLPLVVEMSPLSVRVLAPIERAPLLRASVPPTVTAPPKLMPLARLMVRLFNVIADRVVLAPAPPKMMFADAPPARLPPPVEIAPLIVSVLAPIESAPLVSVSVPLIAVSVPRETPPELLIVTLFRTEGS